MIFAKFKTVIKKDYFGNLYETTVIDDGKKPDLGELWSGFRQQFLHSVENSNSLNRLANGKQEVSKEWYERESEKQLLNDQK